MRTSSTFEGCLSLSSLFPHLAGLRLEQVTLGGEIVRLHMAASARFAHCPPCTRRSKLSTPRRVLAGLA